MSARLEAAAKAIWDIDRPETCKIYEECREGTKRALRREATAALSAADAVMFSDAAIERAARAVHDLGAVPKWEERDEEIRELYREDVRAVVAALRAGAE